jgi:DNA-binding response OmpR family regulator
VVVADDDPDVRELVAEYLEIHGFEVLQAANGLEALLQVKRMRPGAVVLDLQMPRLGGLDALRRIRAFDPTIAVVVATAETDADVHRQALAFGAVAVLVKPVAPADLLAALAGATPSSPSPIAVASSLIEAPSPSGRPAVLAARVLVVDDDPEVRAMLEEFLTTQGYQPRGAADGATAVREIVQAPPDVVLLDIEMPGFSGIEALPTIRAVAPHVAVIMVSGTNDVELSKRALACGAFDYVVKPIDFAYLARSLETALMMKALEP